MIADELPTEENTNGLYGTEFSPEGLLRHGHQYSTYNKYSADVFGIIQIRGKSIIYTDGIIRGEYAKIVCLFVPANEQANKTMPALMRNYPNTPVYVLHDAQIAETLFRTLNQRRQQNDDQCSY